MRYSTRRPDAAINAAVAKCVRDAEALWEPEKYQGEWAEGGIGIRRLVPLDFRKSSSAGFGDNMSGFAWTYSIATASTYETWIDATLSDSSYVVITGLFSLDAVPNVRMIKFTIDGKEYAPINFEELYALDVARVWLETPIIIRPEKTVETKMMGGAAGTGSLGLLGYAVGKRSYVIKSP